MPDTADEESTDKEKTLMPLPVVAMMLCTFCIGTAESVIAGILPAIATDVGVSLSAVGMLISVYAVAVVLLGPFVTAATVRLRQSVLMPCMMGVFVLGNVLAALSPGFGWLIAGRVVSALVHSTLIAAFVAAARDMAPADRRAAWGAKVTLGIGLSSVAGVPAGTLIGNAFGWRATFWALAALSLAAGALLMRCTVPDPLPTAAASGGTTDTVQRKRALPGPMLLVALVIVLGTGGVFALYTYASPYLTQSAGFGPQTVTVLLLLYGAGGILGNTVGGRAADHSPRAAVLVTLGTATATLMLLSLPVGGQGIVAGLFCLLGAAYFATIPALNTQIVTAAGTASPTMALTINNSAFCVGIALGSWLGGFLLAHGHALPSVAAAGAALTGAALLLALVSVKHGRGTARTPEPAIPKTTSPTPR
ncbi:MFS transporter [Streptomyces sp. SID12501]|uniref:MFS transporter n=1 Tax=Streptomyces sp. SID12501 TaxID=2706042 RepID=A0A6B3C5T6_9ACTN|nr:MFS transporter [Streptomyces sp. SID12501]NEC91776.1 MFS transporter [Streptomyces sp. SID12501]